MGVLSRILCRFQSCNSLQGDRKPYNGQNLLREDPYLQEDGQSKILVCMEPGKDC